MLVPAKYVVGLRVFSNTKLLTLVNIYRGKLVKVSFFQLFMLQMNYARYMEILKSMTSVGGSDDYRLLFSLRPVILLAASLFVWLLVFVFVLLYMMEDSNKSEWHSAKLK